MVYFYLFLQLFDGHNGSAAAIYSKENLLNNILNAIPSNLNRDEWLAALPRALVAGFVKTDKDFQTKGMVVISCCIFYLSIFCKIRITNDSYLNIYSVYIFVYIYVYNVEFWIIFL